MATAVKGEDDKNEPITTVCVSTWSTVLTDGQSALDRSASPPRAVRLVKLPQWLAEQVLSAEPGSEIGVSEPLDGSGSARFVMTSPCPNKPAEYTITVANRNALSVISAGDSGQSLISTVSSVGHLVPQRDEKYSKLLRERQALADTSSQHRTAHDQESRVGPPVHLFKRAEDDVTPSPSSPDTVTAAGSQRRGTKRKKQIEELPHFELSARSSSSTLAVAVSSSVIGGKEVDEAVMETLVREDIGWTLQNLSKRIKTDGAQQFNQAQLKMVLLDICKYERRGEDTHPKYYLKAEYKK